MASKPDPQALLRDLLVSQTGGYLRNVVWDARTCSYCAGIPGSPGFSTCYACNRLTYRSDLSDRRGFLTYGIDGAQSGSVMYRYKDDVPPRAVTRAMTLLLAYGLTKHLRCVADPDHGSVTAWTTVPSLSGRTNHPLAEFARPFLEVHKLSEITLGVAPGAQKVRQIRPENFVANPDETRGRNVLLLEDTWVSGSNPESAAAALKGVGAAFVTTLVVARWLTPGRGDTAEFVRQNLTSDYDPDICPYTGAHC